MIVLVMLSALPFKAGGRRSPILGGYRGSWSGPTIDDGQNQHTGQVFLPTGAETTAGVPVQAVVVPMRPEFWTRVHIHDVIDAHEGEHLVCFASVVEVFRP